MKRTVLYEKHLDLNAKMVEFGGWNMPIQYQGIKDETNAVRTKAGLFDVSHMGEILVSGPDSGQFLNWLLSRRVIKKNQALCIYTIMCLPTGAAVDDFLVYRMGDDSYLLVVNASNCAKDYDFILKSLDLYLKDNPKAQVEVVDQSPDYGQIAIQGPESLGYLVKALEDLSYDSDFITKVKELRRFRRLILDSQPVPIIISRTGYTGEDGYEVYLPEQLLPALWQNLIDQGVVPCGLGSRDALRLEAGLPLYGHELSEELSPLDADLEAFVELDRDFQGKAMQKRFKLIPLLSETRAIARDGYKVFFKDEEVGVVSSGSFSPTLEKGIALARVSSDFDFEEASLDIEIRGKMRPFKRTDLPFVK